MTTETVLTNTPAKAHKPGKNHILVRVDAIRDEAPGIRSFTVSRVDGHPFDVYEPGAHIDVCLPDAPVRQYSLCGDPKDIRTLRFAVKLEAQSRGGSSAIHAQVQEGCEFLISVPRNLFRLVQHATDHVLIAAGIGITPMLNMAYHLRQASIGSFTLHYFVRSTADAAFIDLLSRAPFAGHVTLHVGVAREMLDAELMVIFDECPPTAHAYTCGPAPFMDRVIAVGERTLPEENLHLERFSASPDLATGVPNGADVETFEVVAVQSQKRVRVSSGQTIVSALAAVGIEIDTSCEEGICGTCIVDVVEGEPEHRDHCLSKAERAANKTICCCVSRSKSAIITLDI